MVMWESYSKNSDIEIFDIIMRRCLHTNTLHSYTRSHMHTHMHFLAY